MGLFFGFLEDMKMIGNLKLRLKIHEREITQTALSKESGIPRGYINGAIMGRVILSPQEKKKVAHVLNCKISEIF